VTLSWSTRILWLGGRIQQTKGTDAAVHPEFNNAIWKIWVGAVSLLNVGGPLPANGISDVTRETRLTALPDSHVA